MTTTPGPFVEQRFHGNDKLEFLRQEIRSYMSHICYDQPGMTPNQLGLMAVSLTMFVDKAIRKFMAGQIEHGGDLRDRDLQEEIAKEHIDLFWYQEANKWPPHML